jgi:hypothetical protein
MQETYPEQPDLILSDDTYALRVSVFEDGVEMGFHNYQEEEQQALKSCIDDLITIHSSRFTFEIDAVLGEENEFVTILVCKMDGHYAVPFPLSLIDSVVYFSSGKEKHLVGEKIHVHPRSDKYKWADKVEILLEEYVD